MAPAAGESDTKVPFPVRQPSAMTISCAKQRVRARTQRSRSGCRTCRARRIKCDETPGACQKCTSTGRVCDGYDVQRLPRSRIIQEPATGMRWAVTSDEQRCFFLFKDCFVPRMFTLWDCPIWERTILRMCQSDRAFFHAAVAISAEHQGDEANGLVLTDQDHHNSAWTLFAVDQANRSFAILMHRVPSQDPELRLALLGCCVLFSLQANLQGEYIVAARHIQGGLAIVREFKVQGGEASLIEKASIAALLHLALVSAFFGIGSPWFPPDADRSKFAPGALAWTDTFHSARDTLDIFFHDALLFLSDYWLVASSGEWHDDPVLPSRYQHLLVQLDHCERSITLVHHQFFTRLEQSFELSSDIVCAMHDSLLQSARACLLQCRPAVLKTTLPAIKRHLAYLQDVRCRLPKRPSMMMDMALVPTLFLLSAGCPDGSIQSLASRALDCWPHNPSLFNDLVLSMVQAEYKRTSARTVSVESLEFGDVLVHTENSSQGDYIDCPLPDKR
ncbi:hypothetical protein BJY00DRAFT_294768 [Aspergillus carlsbadensis]|nr:hypothetical protein BJY00DRAFT_294768 [Aspergillus carlsbadensis]